MRFVWDDDKNKTNLQKHGLSFEDAHHVFSGPCVTFVDDRFDYGELRFITLGVLAGRSSSSRTRPVGTRPASSP